jgi:CubicO group peptidase (beta-lactamase class C family)
MDEYLQRLQGFGFSGQLLILKDDELILHKGYGLANREKEIPVTTSTLQPVAVKVNGVVLQRSAEEDLAQKIESIVAPAFAKTETGGVVLVAKQDRILFRKAYGLADVERNVPMRPDHVLSTGSITKQFTAVAILQLVTQGRLSLEDDVRKHVPEFNTHGSVITIEQLLTHTSGLSNVVDRDDFEILMRQDHDPMELLELTNNMPLHFPPGQGFYYSDSGYFLLGVIIERISGQSYADYLESKLFRPLAMADTWYGDQTRIIPRRARGYSLKDGKLVNAQYISMTVPYSAGAVFSTVDDLLKWDQALRSGNVVPQKLLKQAWSTRLLPDGTVSGYGFGWKMCTLAGHPTLEHGGFLYGYSAGMLRLPEDQIMIVVLANNDADVPDAGALARKLGRFLITGVPEVQHRTLTSQQLEALIGKYEISPDNIRVITDQNGILHLQRNNDAPRPLHPVTETVFTFAEGDDGLVFRFELGKDGQAKKLRAASRCEPVYTATRK